jgi:hypothetical protein
MGHMEHAPSPPVWQGGKARAEAAAVGLGLSPVIPAIHTTATMGTSGPASPSPMPLDPLSLSAPLPQGPDGLSPSGMPLPLGLLAHQRRRRRRRAARMAGTPSSSSDASDASEGAGEETEEEERDALEPLYTRAPAPRTLATLSPIHTSPIFTQQHPHPQQQQQQQTQLRDSTIRESVDSVLFRSASHQEVHAAASTPTAGPPGRQHGVQQQGCVSGNAYLMRALLDHPPLHRTSTAYASALVDVAGSWPTARSLASLAAGSTEGALKEGKPAAATGMQPQPQQQPQQQHPPSPTGHDEEAHYFLNRTLHAGHLGMWSHPLAQCYLLLHLLHTRRQSFFVGSVMGCGV